MTERKNTVTEEQFKAWLDSDRIEPIKIIARYETSAIFLKAPKGKDFFYLYKQRLHENEDIVRHKNFEYAGLYSVKQGLIYEREHDLKEWYPNLTSDETLSMMKEKAIAGVRAYVEEKLSNDSTNLDLEALPVEYEKRLKDRQEQWIGREATKRFVFGYGSQSVRYQCEYAFLNWSEDELLEYISNPEDFIQRKAEQYLQDKQADILFQFKSNELLSEAIKKIEAKTDSRLHRRRDIIQAMMLTDAKKVFVTVEKDGQSFSFKYEAGTLRQADWGYYSTWDMAKQDREEFQKLFGQNADFCPEDIVDISYRGKSLYSAEPYVPEQDIGIKQTM